MIMTDSEGMVVSRTANPNACLDIRRGTDRQINRSARPGVCATITFLAPRYLANPSNRPMGAGRDLKAAAATAPSSARNRADADQDRLRIIVLAIVVDITGRR